MTPEQRLRRLERVTKMLINKGRRARSEWREQSREQAEKIDILIQMQMKTDEQIEKLAVAQAELTKSQDRTDRALRAFINSLRKGRNGDKAKH
jgi:hypothetical protein